MPAAEAIAEQAEPQAQRFNEEVIIPRGQQLAEQVCGPPSYHIAVNCRNQAAAHFWTGAAMPGARPPEPQCQSRAKLVRLAVYALLLPSVATSWTR